MTPRRTRWIGLAAVLLLGAARAEEPTRVDVPPKADGTLRIVCFGDSITGYRPYIHYQDRYLKFADLLQRALRRHPDLRAAEVWNAGWAGDRTFPKPNEGWPGAVGRLERDVLDVEPDIAIVLIGGNDGDRDRAGTLTNLTTIVTRIREAGIRLLMLAYHPALPDPAAPEKAWNHLDDNNDLIRKAAGAQDVPTLAMGPPMAAAAAEHPVGAVCNAVDGVHLGPVGEAVYARTILDKLVSLGWVPAPPGKDEAP